MKKYRLKIKDYSVLTDEYKKQYNFNEYTVKRKYLNFYAKEHWLCDENSMTYNKGLAFFTQDQLDNMPYGMIKNFEIEEVEEQLYYIELPYVNKSNPSRFINLFDGGNTVISDIIDGSNIKTKFTIEEVKEYYPLYANDKFLVKVEELNK